MVNNLFKNILQNKFKTVLNIKQISFLFLLILFLVSCDILSTRDAEAPDTQRKNYLPATTPDILFLNLENALKEKVVENYMACFSDAAFSPHPFLFIPSSESIVSYPSLSDWSIIAEQQYFSNLVVATKEDIPIILDLRKEIKNTMGDSAVYQYDYILTLSPKSENLETSYRGNLKFYIFLDSRNQWIISRWEDIKTSENPTWSELKGALY